MFKKISILLLIVAVGLTLISVAPALAAYPEKPITIICMYGAGGSTDIFIRTLQPALEKALGVKLIIKNISGGGGAAGFNAAYLAKPDGYTMTIPNNALFALEGIGHVTFSYKDFDILARVILEDYVILANPKKGWDTVDKFIKNVKTNPAKYSIAHCGVGGSTHIVAEAFVSEFNLDMIVVPQEGGANAIAALMGGHIDAVVSEPGEAISGIKTGDINALAVVGKQRNHLLSDVPTLMEKGFEFEVNNWRGIGGPKGLSEEVKKVWEKAVKEAVKNDKFVDLMQNEFATTVSPAFGDELNDFVKKMSNIFTPKAAEIAAKTKKQ